MNDKSFEWRMQGMIYACKMAKEKGIEYLEQDIKRRNVLKADIVYKDNQVREFWNTMSNNIYTNMLTTVLWVLHDKYGFRRERLHKFLNYYNDAVNITLDLATWIIWVNIMSHWKIMQSSLTKSTILDWTCRSWQHARVSSIKRIRITGTPNTCVESSIRFAWQDIMTRQIT